MYGNTHSEETKSKMSSAHNGNTHSEETKIKMRKPKSKVCCLHCKKEISTSNIDRHYNACIKPIKIKKSQAGKNNPRAKHILIFNNDSVLQYNCEGCFVKTCKENNLPYNKLTESYKMNGERLYSNLDIKSERILLKNGKIKYKGWYALIKL